MKKKDLEKAIKDSLDSFKNNTAKSYRTSIKRFFKTNIIDNLYTIKSFDGIKCMLAIEKYIEKKVFEIKTRSCAIPVSHHGVSNP
jgi:hypothetical protein